MILGYDWEVPDMPSVCVCGDNFNVDHAMICKRNGFVIQRHSELKEAEMLRMSAMALKSSQFYKTSQAKS